MTGHVICYCTLDHASTASTHAGNKLSFSTSLAACTSANLARCQHARDVCKVYNVAEEDSYTGIEFWLHRPPLLQSRRHLQMRDPNEDYGDQMQHRSRQSARCCLYSYSLCRAAFEALPSGLPFKQYLV